MKRLELVKVLTIAILVGILTGLSAVLYNFILSVGSQTVSKILSQDKLFYLIIPFIGAFLSSILYYMGAYDVDYGLGVGQVLAEIKTFKKQLIKPFRLVFNILSSWITLIFGFTAGRFGPIVHMGASIGSILAYKLSLNPESFRLLIGCGIGGTLASVFGLPFFAVVFVFEVVFREAIYKNIAPLLLAAYASYGISNYLGVSKPLLPVIEVHSGVVFSLNHILFLILLSLVIIGLAVLYISSIEFFSFTFKGLKFQYSRFFLVALAVGGAGYVLPLQMELHNATLVQILSGQLPLVVLMLLMGLHIVTTGMTLGAGYIGGSFFPSLVIGSAGSVFFFGITKSHFQLGYSVDQMGVLGGCAMIGAIMNAPISAIALCLEITQSTALLVPAILVISISGSFTHLVLQRDIFTKTLHRILKKSA